MEREHTGVLGAKVSSWEPHGLRSIVKEVLDEDPYLSNQELTALTLEKIKSLPGSDEYIYALALQSVANIRRSLMRSAPLPRHSTAISPAAVEASKNVVIATATRLVLFTWILPNGKRLKDSTFAECRQIGGWLSGVADLGQPDQVVGQVVTEAQVGALYRAYLEQPKS